MSEKSSSLSIISGGAVIFFIGNVTKNVSKFLLQIFLTRSLGAASYGIYSYAQTILSVAGVFARLGVTESIMRFIPKFQGDKNMQNGYITIAFCTSIVGSILVSTGLFVFSDWINRLTLNNSFFPGVLRIFAILLPFQVTTQAISNTFRAFESAKGQIFIRDIIVPLLNLTSIIIALILGATVIGASAAVAFAGVFAAILSLSILVKSVNINMNFNVDANMVSQYYRFSFPLTLTAAGTLLYTNVDRLMVGYFLGEVEVGIYAVTIGLASATGLALSGLNQLFPPIASKLYSQGQKEELQKIFRTTTRWSLTLCLLPALLLFTFRYEVLSLFGPDFTRGSVVLSLFIVAQVTRSAVGPSGYMIMMTNHQYVVLFNRWFLGVSNVLSNYILITRFGFVGAAIASAFTITMVNIFRLIEIWILEEFHPYTQRILKPIIVAVVVILLTSLIRLELIAYGISGPILIMIGSIVGTSAYLLLLYYLGINQVDFEVYRELRGENK